MFEQAKGMDCPVMLRDGRKEAKGEEEKENAITASTSAELLD